MKLKVNNIFDIMVRIFILSFMLLSIICSIVMIDKISLNYIEYYNIISIYFILSVLGIIVLMLKIDNRIKMLLMFLIAIIIRCCWICFVPTKLVSDYMTIYDVAIEFLSGNVDGMRGYNYLSRFPHLIPMMLSMSCIIHLFPTYHLIVFKFINVILSIISMKLIIDLSQYFMKNKNSRLIIAFLYATNISSIGYVSTYATENIAIPLFLFTILIFLKTLNFKNKSKVILGIIFTGIMLIISDLFRQVGIILLIAFCLYMIFYTNDKLKNKTANIIILIITYLITNVLISQILINLDIIDKPLYKGMEPKITSILKGSNVENLGRWNKEDAEFVSQNLGNIELSNMCKEKILSRITSLNISQAFMFLIEKYGVLWSLTDNGAIMLAMNNSNIIGIKSFQFIGIIIMILSFISLFNNSKKEMKLLHIIYIGITCFFLIIEVQPRYTYIISWIPIIMTANGIQYIIEKIKNIIGKINRHNYEKIIDLI